MKIASNYPKTNFKKFPKGAQQLLGVRLLAFLLLPMSREALKVAGEGVSRLAITLTPVDGTGKAEVQSSGSRSSVPPPRLETEHNYARLIPFKNAYSTGSKGSSFSTVVLFADRIRSKLKKKSVKKRKSKYSKSRVGGVEEVQSHGEVSTEEGEPSTLPTVMETDAEPRYVHHYGGGDW